MVEDVDVLAIPAERHLSSRVDCLARRRDVDGDPIARTGTHEQDAQSCNMDRKSDHDICSHADRPDRVLRAPELPPPNGSRLSCGAELEGSQTEFYNTEAERFSRSCRARGAASFKRWLGTAHTEIRYNLQ